MLGKDDVAREWGSETIRGNVKSLRTGKRRLQAARKKQNG